MNQETSTQKSKESGFKLKQPKVQSFRSMRSDTIDIVQKNDKSLAQMVIAAQEKKRKQNKLKSELFNEKKKEQRMLITIVLVLLLTLSVILLGVKIKNIVYEKRSEVHLETPSLILPNSQLALNIGGIPRSDFIKLINDTIVPGAVEQNNIVHIYFTDAAPGTSKKLFSNEALNIVPIRKLLELTGDYVPSYTLRSLQGDYTFGIYGYGETRSEPFLLLKVSDYDAAFAGMLEWENNMENDLTILFKLRHSGVERGFSDAMVANQDVRLLKTRQGKTALLYSFIDRETLLITTNKKAFEEIVYRYNNPVQDIADITQK